jgi:hypothetical protein
MTDYTELKRLAKAATPGEWECREAEGMAAICHEHGWVADDFSGQALIDTRYMAAANPAAVLELIADLEAERQRRWDGNEISSREHAEEVRKLKAENEQLRRSLEDCSDSLHSEMLQKFGGQLPDDMHPVTRREYDRDMAEVAGYRAALRGVDPDLDTPAEAQS